MKKLAVIRAPKVRSCPFGLPIAIACKNAGDSVKQMEALKEIAPEKRNKYIKSNRRVYRHHKDGSRCTYADKIVEGKDIVHCDFGDTGEGISDFPIRPSPFYPRVFSGLGQAGLFSYPLTHYLDHSESQQLFDGIFYMYASTGEVPIQKVSNFEPDYYLLSTYNEIKSLLDNVEE